MPRYFFTTEDGDVVRDNSGEELTDQAAARRAAVKLMGSILNDAPEELLADRRWRLVVSTEQDGDLFSLEVNMLTGAAISDWGDPEARTSPTR